jgi:hypothetical protein
MLMERESWSGQEKREGQDETGRGGREAKKVQTAETKDKREGESLTKSLQPKDTTENY